MLQQVIPFVKAETGPFGFDDITSATLIAHWDMADPSVRIEDLTGTPSISQFNDLTGNGHHLIQAVKARQYVINPNFSSNDGTKDMIVDLGVDFPQPTTIIILHTKIDVTGTSVYDGVTSGKRQTLFSSYNLFAGASRGTSGSFDVSIPHLASSIFDGASARFYYNAGEISLTSTTVGTHVLRGITLGARFNTVSQITHNVYEMGVFSGTVSAQDIIDLNEGLATKHNLTLA